MILSFPNERDIESDDWRVIFGEVWKRLCTGCIADSSEGIAHSKSIREMTYSLLDTQCGAEILLEEDGREETKVDAFDARKPKYRVPDMSKFKEKWYDEPNDIAGNKND